MKKTILSVLIANLLTANTFAYAADERSFIDEAMMFGGHVGTSFEYEDKVTNDFNNNEKIEKTQTNEIGSLFYKNAAWNISALYSLKTSNRKQTNPGYWENEDSLKQFISLNKGFQLSSGWSTGLVYDLEYISSKVYSPYVTGLRKTSAEHSLRPYLNYWSNDYNFGLDSNLEYLLLNEDKSAWGQREEKGYSALIKPYYQLGNLEVALEFYYQIKDNFDKDSTGKTTATSDFSEKYIEPVIQYSFEDAGVFYVRARFGENETDHTSGWSKDQKYFKDIRKATMGYEQSVGDSWLLKAEYEYANEKESRSLDTKESELKQHTVFAQAVYRL